jgi:hypothetical protein
MTETKKPRGRPRKPNKLLEEAKQFKQERLPPDKPLDTRMYLAGQAMAGLLASHSGGYMRLSELKRQAFELADKMLEDD